MKFMYLRQNLAPNARWRDGFSLVPSIPVGCAGNAR